MDKHKITINGEHDFELDAKNFADDWNLVDLGNGQYHIIVGTQSINAQIVETLPESKQVKLMVNGQFYTADIKTDMDLLLEKMGMGHLSAQKAQDLKAPMPGLVLEIKVAAGDSVEKGDAVLVLEAMKMENVLKASNSATVKAITVTQGQAVEKGEVLIEFE